MAAGLGLLATQLYPAWQKLSDRARSSAVLSTLLILPFAMVWFWGYSYHYRLMLTITPPLAAMVAALLDGWLIPFMSQNPLRRRALVTIGVLLSLPALMMGSYLTLEATLVTPLRSDEEKYAHANPALMEAVEALEEANAARPGRDYLNVYTLGEKRLNFFFPEMQTIWNRDLPTDLDELFHLTDLVIGGSHAEFIWANTDATYPNQLSSYMDIGFNYTRPFVEYQGGNIMGMVLEPIKFADDGNNRLEVYNVYTPYRNYSIEEVAPPITFDSNQWEFIALRGLDVRRVITADSQPILPDENGLMRLQAGEEIYIQLYWQREDETLISKDYSVFIHLVDPDTGDIYAQRDGEIGDGLLPTTLMPYPDLVPDRRLWQLPDDLPSGEIALYVGLYDPALPDAPRLPIVNGEYAGEDGILLTNQFVVE